MLRRSVILVCLVLLCGLTISGCQKSPSLPTSAPLLSPTSSTPTPSLAPIPGDTPTKAPPPASPQATFELPTDTPPSTAEPAPTDTPTPTPLPTWPDRWQQTGGPIGGSMSAVAISPTDPGLLLAAGLGGAIYRSQESGIWYAGERVTVPHCAFSSLIFDSSDENVAYAANLCDGILKSMDGGESWIRTDTGQEDGIAILAQSPHAPGLLVAASNQGQVFQSTDRARSWVAVSTGLPGDRIGGLSISAPDVFWATADGNGTDLYRFQGTSWSLVQLGRPTSSRVTNVYVDAKDPATIYVGLEYIEHTTALSETVGLLRSADGGRSWEHLKPWAQIDPSSAPVPSASTRVSVHVLGRAHGPDVLYISNGDQMLGSEDNGDTWRDIPLPIEALADAELRQMAVGEVVNYLPLSNGIVKCSVGCQSWSTLNEGLNSLPIGAIATHPTDGATVYATSAQGLLTYRSGDYGETWARLGTAGLERAISQRIVELQPDRDQQGNTYLITGAGQAFQSSDGGATWESTWPGFRFSSVNSLLPALSDPSRLFATRSGFGLFGSDDKGQTWRLLRDAGVTDVQLLSVHPNDGAHMLISERHTGPETTASLRRSRDGGASWDTVLEVPESSGVTSAVFDPRVEPYFRPGSRPDEPLRLYAASTGARGTLWFSNDAGESWKPLNNDLNFADVKTLTVVPGQAGVVYASLSGNGTWRSEDGGQDWGRLQGDPASTAVGISVDPADHNIIYIADGTTPHLYRSSDFGSNWELLFDAGLPYSELTSLAMAPSDPRILYVSASGAISENLAGAIFRINTGAGPEERVNDATGNLPSGASSLAVDRYDPLRVFVTVDGAGLWKTDDGGISWHELTDGLPRASFNQIAIDPSQPNTLYLVGGHDVQPDTSERIGLAAEEMHGVWKSTDDGNSWMRVGGTTFGRTSGPVRAIAFHPDDARVKYVVGENGVYLSPDNGETWTSINGRLPFSSMNTISTDGQSLYVGSSGGGTFAGPIHPLIHTVDWTRESSLVPSVDYVQIVLDPRDPQVIYVSAYPGGIFKTQDGGKTWSARDFGLPAFTVTDRFQHGRYMLAIAPTAANTLYVALFGRGVYRSGDGAETWRPVLGESGELHQSEVQALLVHTDNPDIVYVATTRGISRTVNGGQSWSGFDDGLPRDGDVRALALDSENGLYAGTGGYGIYTRDAFHQAGDDAWRQLAELGGWDDLATSASVIGAASLAPANGDADTFLVSSYPAGVFGTDDGGLSWREGNLGLRGLGVLSLVRHPTDNSMIYAGTTDGVSRSIDGGSSWHSWAQGWQPGHWVVSIAVDPTDADILFACSSSRQLRQQPSDPLLAASDDDGGGTVYKSTDGGATWVEVTTGLDAELGFRGILIDRFDSRILYLATEQDGVYISRDSGTTWTSWNEGLWDKALSEARTNSFDTLEISADGRLLFLGSSGSGVWRRPAAGIP